MFIKTIQLYKTSFTGLSKETWLLSLVMLINRSGTMVMPFMTLYLTGKEMNRSLSEAGFVMALFGLGSIVGAYFGGKFTDKIGFYKVQLLALLLGGILFMLLGQIKSYPLICLCTFILSMLNESFRPANSSAIANYSKPENITRSYSLNRLAINLGWAVGGSLGGLIASFDYELLFWIDGFTNVFAAILLIYFLKPTSKIKKEKSIEHTQPIKSAYKDKTYLFYIFLIGMYGFCFFQLFTTIPKYFRDNLFLSEQFIGLLMAINGVIIVLLEMVLIYSLEKKKNMMYYVSIGTFICALSFFSLLIPGNAKYIALLMIIIISFGEILAMPFMNTFWTMRADDTNRGQYAALFTMAWGVAQTLGPFLCAALVDYSSFNTLFIVLGIILSTTAIGFYKLKTN
jgi:predicted MFS family arabinose efflux permease